ncbi:MAG: hypothetical protein LBN05_07325 [Oscillospiraceae bacterium]|jgi:hypothetical protein|nr:hypothetical protein [Oscillospiraceae bacterium]
MALIWFDNNGKIDDIPGSRKKFFAATCQRLQKIGVSERPFYEYITKVLDDIVDNEKDSKVFIRPGFIFPRDSEHWDVPSPLAKLWQQYPEGIGYSEQDSGNFLGLLVYQYMIDSPLNWYCTKTQFNNRAFETNVYWANEH